MYIKIKKGNTSIEALSYSKSDKPRLCIDRNGVFTRYAVFDGKAAAEEFMQLLADFIER